MYNIHPLLVHFPIALLFVYSVIKIVPVGRWFPSVSWKHIERALLFFGVLGAFAALATGETAEHLTNPNHQLVEMHSTFASLATWLYGALLAGEICTVINPMMVGKSAYAMLLKLTTFVEKILCNKYFSMVLAVVALVAISVTGLLGGVMVYGVSADPVAGSVLKILGITL